MTELTLILAIVLVVMGPEKIPTIARALGRATREFRKATREIQASLHVEDVRRSIKERVEQEKKAIKDAVEEPGKAGAGPTTVSAASKASKPADPYVDDGDEFSMEDPSLEPEDSEPGTDSDDPVSRLPKPVAAFGAVPAAGHVPLPQTPVEEAPQPATASASDDDVL
ncbi:MAG: twin-arginine translocase TatA/TatE family subunit, partial [Myxococcales bacterium]|nr:twin-arginine translocase TatA/TatE family subunit [Myxococcales bacterium]